MVRAISVKYSSKSSTKTDHTDRSIMAATSRRIWILVIVVSSCVTVATTSGAAGARITLTSKALNYSEHCML